MGVGSGNTDLWTGAGPSGGGETAGEARAPAGENGEALPAVEMVVRDPGSCPILVEGGRMVYVHPEIVKEESDRICAQALSTLAPAAEEVARSAASGLSESLWRRELELNCQIPDCGAVFVLRPLAANGGEAGTSARTQDAGTEPVEGARAEALAKPGTVTRRLTHLAPSAEGRGPFLSRLDPEVIGEIVDLSDVMSHDEPTVIIRAGQEGEALYIVAEGEVEVVYHREDGHEVVLAVPGKGECLGEMSLLTGQPTSATVRTRGRGTTVLVLAREELEGLLGRRPELHKEFSRIIAERLYQTNAALQAEASHGIAGRLAMIGIVDLVQTLHAAHRTGTLIVEGGDEVVARVGFREGAVTAAMVGDRPGAEGFYDLLAWRDGDFTFEGGGPALEGVAGAAIQGDTMGLLMEGLRRLDEGNR